MPIPDELLQRIRDNDLTLTSLKLENNQIGPLEAQALAAAIEKNITLTSLDLRHGGIGNEGAQALVNALENNPTLTSLDLLGYIGLEGNTVLYTIKEITKRNKNIIPEISRIISEIISGNPEERLSDPQIRFISDSSHPENCVRI